MMSLPRRHRTGFLAGFFVSDVGRGSGSYQAVDGRSTAGVISTSGTGDPSVPAAAVHELTAARTAEVQIPVLPAFVSSQSCDPALRSAGAREP